MAALSDDDMVKVTAIAPFEVAEVIRDWAECVAQDPTGLWAATHGYPQPMQDETPADFGRRMASAIFTLLKEI